MTTSAIQVIAFLKEAELPYDGTLTAETSLIQSGLLDSLILFRLALWIEAEAGQPIDLADVEIAQAWDTPEQIARFIDGLRNRA